MLCLFTIFIGAGYAGLWLMIPSMQIDVVDLDELKTGERREGSFASVFSWVLKLSFCIGFLISGPLLELTGFDAAMEGDQPRAVLRNMRLGYVAIPVTALLLALLLLKFFPINPAKVKRLEVLTGGTAEASQTGNKLTITMDKVNPHPMELMDLVPTTFELAGVADPNATAKNGLSVVPLLDGKETNG